MMKKPNKILKLQIFLRTKKREKWTEAMKN